MDNLQNVLQLSTAERAAYIEAHGEALFATMLAQIGALNPEVRDATNYRLFIELLSEQLIPNDTLISFATQLVTSDYLYKGMGEESADDVFTRSFAALWLTGLFHADRQLAFLQPEQAKSLLASSVHYLAKERDVRGFVEEKGWAHSVAHGADLAAAIIAHPHAEVRYGAQILQGITTALWRGTVYIDDEEERLVTVIEALAAQAFPEEVLVEWMEQLFERLEQERMYNGYTQAFFYGRTNTLRFAKTLYFTLKFSQRYDQLRGVTSLLIGKWMKLQ